jgi:predicted O-methyltransferase YrrM
MAAFNQHVANDARVSKVMLPLRDGLMMVRWRQQ